MHELRRQYDKTMQVSNCMSETGAVNQHPQKSICSPFRDAVDPLRRTQLLSDTVFPQRMPCFHVNCKHIMADSVCMWCGQKSS